MSPGLLQRLDARVKILGLIAALIVCVSTPPDQYLAFAGYFALVCAGLVVSRVSGRAVARRLLVVAPIILLGAAFIPFLHPDAVSGGYNLGLNGLRVSRSGLLIFWNVAAKACFGVLAMTLLAETTPFPVLVAGLRRLGVPRLVVLLLSFTHRYAFVLVDEARRMKRALDARGFSDRWLWDAASVGRMIGALFLRSYERGERVYLAMLARGFDGALPGPATSILRASDCAFFVATTALFMLLRVGGS
jgi:cobalt/nickel transport system permease protein